MHLVADSVQNERRGHKNRNTRSGDLRGPLCGRNELVTQFICEEGHHPEIPVEVIL